jgi:hypothetical protein
MARTIEVTLYKFDELGAAMQQRVIEGWRAGDQFFWEDEWRDSLHAFAKLAPIKVRDWSVGYGGTYVTFDMDDDIADLSGDEAHAWLIQEGWDALANPDKRQSCPFTGYCGDENLLDAIRTAIGNPASISSLRDVFADALQGWAKGFEADLDYWHSEEAIREDIEANGYEFNANGTLA